MRHFSLYCMLALLFATPLTVRAEEPARPGNQDRCPVCGMFVAHYPAWVATLVFNDGSQLFFDGPKDLFRYYFSLPNKDDSRTRTAVAKIYVSEYYSTRWVPAQQVYFISGSDVYGPMGAELIPVAGKSAAAIFLTDHNGQKILSFEQLSKEQLPTE